MNALKHFTSVMCLFLLCPFFIQAQSNYKPGFVVTTAGDTLQGFINYKEWGQNPITITFRQNADGGQEQIFDAGSSRYFEISGFEAYQSYEGPITMNPLDIQNLSTNSSTIVANATVFLKILEAGDKIAFLSYTDRIKARYFVQEQDGTSPQELYYNKYYVASTGKTQIIEQKGYIGQLQFLASKYGASSAKLTRDIESAAYRSYALQTIVNKLNGHAHPRPSTTSVTEKSTRFYAGLAIYSNTASIEGQNIMSNATHNKASMSPRVVVGADIFLNRHVQKMQFRIEASAGSAKYAIKKTERSGSAVTEHTYGLSQQTATFSPQFIYNLYNTDQIKAYLGLGLQFNYSTYSDNTYHSQYSNPNIPYEYKPVTKKDYLVIEPLWVSYSIRSGLIINRKFELAAAYMPPVAVTRYVGYSLNLSSYAVGVNYLFSRK
ncbi:hypothetical protein [Pontibacter beigongshangensis]|uniref:hypothetical protein n=1 Tax=Pontibacter beigongshangensis TaxID=2574733 RepID=UPI0016506128|nr:hypothetical protein [Pontibacter beigongshangensis]